MKRNTIFPLGVLATCALPITALIYSGAANAAAPIASDASESIFVGERAFIGLTEFVSDADDDIGSNSIDLDLSTDTVERSITTDAGSWSVTTTGNLTYTPADGFTGVATIQYTVRDRQDTVSSPATISVTVSSGTTPVASNASVAIVAGETATIEISEFVTDEDDNIRFNTTDLDPSTPDRDSSLTTDDGRWSVNTAGRLTFNHADGFAGTATISYTVGDDLDNVSNAANVSVTIANPVPVATNASASIAAGNNATIELSEFVTDPDENIRLNTIDLDPSTPARDSSLTTDDGRWSVGTSGRLTFTHADGFAGTATISYTVADDQDNVSNAANVSVTITNPAPVAANASASITAGNNAIIELSEFVTDPDDNIRLNTIDLDPSTPARDSSLTTDDGRWSVGTSGRLTFNPEDGFAGIATISYIVLDTEDNISNTATVSVTTANPVPVASNASATITAGDRATIELSEFVTDPDDNIRLNRIDLDPSTPDNDNSLTTDDGRWSVGTSGRLTFTPEDGFAGVATISYTVLDDEDNRSNTATVSVTVANPVPVASNVSVTIAVGDRATIELSEFITDSDDNVRLNSIDLDPSTPEDENSLITDDGRWSVGSLGRLTFIPEDDFTGVATISYTVMDDEDNLSNIASVTVTAGVTNAEAETDGTDDADAESDPDTGAAEEGTADGDAQDNAADSLADADNDGIADIAEGTRDADGDGIPNSADEDSDGDGIPDSVEAGTNSESPVDSDGDGIFDFLDVDSDNDGISDTVEGANDSDEDGVVDFRDLDVDNDGILDIIEARSDMAEVNRLDTDLNGAIDLTFATGSNGMANTVETTPESGAENYTVADTDGDNVADFRDRDADNDGLLDTLESDHTDLDLDGTIDDATEEQSSTLRTIAAADPSTGLIPTAGGVPQDTDSDSVADFRDGDSDNDGITDAAESFGTSLDQDGDGHLDDFEDSNSDGVDDELAQEPVLPNDTNNNGSFDAVEIDSDSDGISDLLEAGGTDTDNDGMVDAFLDDDADGIDDSINALPLTPADTDNDNTPDFQDTDSDNDGTSDLIEAGATDTDGDGVADALVSGLLDSDNNGIADHLQNGDGFGTDADVQEANGLVTGLNGTGVGCSIIGSGTDPMLPGMFMLSSLWIIRRYRQAQK